MKAENLNLSTRLTKWFTAFMCLLFTAIAIGLTYVNGWRALPIDVMAFISVLGVIASECIMAGKLWTLDDLILRLEAVRKVHGGAIKVLVPDDMEMGGWGEARIVDTLQGKEHGEEREVAPDEIRVRIA